MFDAIYARQSVEKVDSISVESQLDFCKYETRGNSYKEYIDKGFSGKNTKRPAFENMMKDIKEGGIKRVIVYKLDRISRSILDFSNMIEVFRSYGVEFVSSTEKFDTSTPIGRAMLNICIVFAQLERETIQKRVSDAYYSRSKKGLYMGGKIPYGFSLERTNIDGVNTSKYIGIEDETNKIKLIYSIYSKNNTTLGDVVRYLNNNKLKHINGKDWRTARISELIRNPIYVKSDRDIYNFFKEHGTHIANSESDFVGINGCYLYNENGENNKKNLLEKNYLVLAPHEGIIESNEWIKCRVKLLRNKQVRGGRKPKNSWLVGKIKCAYCGYAMVIRKSKSKGENVLKYFICGSKRSSCCCTTGNIIKVDTLENFILLSIKNHINFLHQNSKARKKGNEAEDISMIEKIDKEIEGLLNKLPMANGQLISYINEKVSLLDNRKNNIKQSIYKPINGNLKQLFSCMLYWDKFNLEDKVTIIDKFISSIKIFDREIEITWKV